MAVRWGTGLVGARTAVRVVVPALALAALTACSNGGPTESVSVPRETVSSAAATTAVPTDTAAGSATSGPPSGTGAATSAPTSAGGTASATTTPTRTPSGTAAATATGAALTLETDGLLIAAAGRPARHHPFGSDAGAVRAALASVLGGPLTLTPSPECGQGPRTTADRDNFTILIDGTTFVGWIDQGSARRHLTTRRGLGIGSTLTQVKVLLSGVTVSNETLGPEFFTTSGLGGLLTGTTNTSTITNIYAGETCFFR